MSDLTGRVVVITGAIIISMDRPALMPCLPVIPFVGYYLWLAAGGTFRGRIAVGIIGVLGTIAIVAFAFDKWGHLDPGHLFPLLFGSWGLTTPIRPRQ